MTFNLSEQQEKKYLQQVIGIINDTIQNTDTSVKEHVETLQEYKDYPLAELNKRIFKSANRFVVNVVYILKDCKCTYFP